MDFAVATASLRCTALPAQLCTKVAGSPLLHPSNANGPSRHTSSSRREQNFTIQCVSSHPTSPPPSKDPPLGTNLVNVSWQLTEHQVSAACAGPREDPESPGAPLLEALHSAAQGSPASFHFPGHRRGRGAWAKYLHAIGSEALAHDLPELPELDNLFAPEGPIQDSQLAAARVFGADKTWFLVNGSTCGVQASVLATCAPGDCLILPRNCHQSAFSAMVLSGALPIYVTPHYDPRWQIAHGVEASHVEAAIRKARDEGKKVGAVLVVSPTYYGVCSDIRSIAATCHNHGVPLIVDEAHGGHFRFHSSFPPTALDSGADVTIQSTHKVLSSLTQSAMLHVRGSRVEGERISQALQLLQSSSPNYLLLSSLDAARAQLTSPDGGPDRCSPLFEYALSLASIARMQLKTVPGITLLDNQTISPCKGTPRMDPLRLTVDVRGLGMDGFTADDILRLEHSVIAELPTLSTLTFAISPGNSTSDIDNLVRAFLALSSSAYIPHIHLQDPGASASLPQRTMAGTFNKGHEHGDLNTLAWESFKGAHTHEGEDATYQENINAAAAVDFFLDCGEELGIGVASISLSHISGVTKISPRDAFFESSERVPWGDAVGRVSAELLCPYPPGIPVLFPGELVTHDALSLLRGVLGAGGSVSGARDGSLETILVIREK